jgi:hypothetical protein
MFCREEGRGYLGMPDKRRTGWQAATFLQHGDVLAIVTDGFTNIFDSLQREIGESYMDDRALIPGHRS